VLTKQRSLAVHSIATCEFIMPGPRFRGEPSQFPRNLKGLPLIHKPKRQSRFTIDLTRAPSRKSKDSNTRYKLQRSRFLSSQPVSYYS
jgi:hypothetical protein